MSTSLVSKLQDIGSLLHAIGIEPPPTRHSPAIVEASTSITLADEALRLDAEFSAKSAAGYTPKQLDALHDKIKDSIVFVRPDSDVTYVDPETPWGQLSRASRREILEKKSIDLYRNAFEPASYDDLAMTTRGIISDTYQFPSNANLIINRTYHDPILLTTFDMHGQATFAGGRNPLTAVPSVQDTHTLGVGLSHGDVAVRANVNETAFHSSFSIQHRPIGLSYSFNTLIDQQTNPETIHTQLSSHSLQFQRNRSTYHLQHYSQHSTPTTSSSGSTSTSLSCTTNLSQQLDAGFRGVVDYTRYDATHSAQRAQWSIRAKWRTFFRQLWNDDIEPYPLQPSSDTIVELSNTGQIQCQHWNSSLLHWQFGAVASFSALSLFSPSLSSLPSLSTPSTTTTTTTSQSALASTYAPISPLALAIPATPALETVSPSHTPLSAAKPVDITLVGLYQHPVSHIIATALVSLSGLLKFTLGGGVPGLPSLAWRSSLTFSPQSSMTFSNPTLNALYQAIPTFGLQLSYETEHRPGFDTLVTPRGFVPFRLPLLPVEDYDPSLGFDNIINRWHDQRENLILSPYLLQFFPNKDSSSSSPSTRSELLSHPEDQLGECSDAEWNYIVHDDDFIRNHPVLSRLPYPMAKIYTGRDPQTKRIVPPSLFALKRYYRRRKWPYRFDHVPGEVSPPNTPNDLIERLYYYGWFVRKKDTELPQSVEDVIDNRTFRFWMSVYRYERLQRALRDYDKEKHRWQFPWTAALPSSSSNDSKLVNRDDILFQLSNKTAAEYSLQELEAQIHYLRLREELQHHLNLQWDKDRRQKELDLYGVSPHHPYSENGISQEQTLVNLHAFNSAYSSYIQQLRRYATSKFHSFDLSKEQIAKIPALNADVPLDNAFSIAEHPLAMPSNISIDSASFEHKLDISQFSLPSPWATHTFANKTADETLTRYIDDNAAELFNRYVNHQRSYSSASDEKSGSFLQTDAFTVDPESPVDVDDRHIIYESQLYHSSESSASRDMDLKRLEAARKRRMQLSEATDSAMRFGAPQFFNTVGAGGEPITSPRESHGVISSLTNWFDKLQTHHDEEMDTRLTTQEALARLERNLQLIRAIQHEESVQQRAQEELKKREDEFLQQEIFPHSYTLEYESEMKEIDQALTTTYQQLNSLEDKVLKHDKMVLELQVRSLENPSNTGYKQAYKEALQNRTKIIDYYNLERINLEKIENDLLAKKTEATFFYLHRNTMMPQSMIDDHNRASQDRFKQSILRADREERDKTRELLDKFTPSRPQAPHLDSINELNQKSSTKTSIAQLPQTDQNDELTFFAQYQDKADQKRIQTMPEISVADERAFYDLHHETMRGNLLAGKPLRSGLAQSQPADILNSDPFDSSAIPNALGADIDRQNEQKRLENDVRRQHGYFPRQELDQRSIPVVADSAYTRQRVSDAVSAHTEPPVSSTSLVRSRLKPQSSPDPNSPPNDASKDTMHYDDVVHPHPPHLSPSEKAAMFREFDQVSELYQFTPQDAQLLRDNVDIIADRQNRTAREQQMEFDRQAKLLQQDNQIDEQVLQQRIIQARREGVQLSITESPDPRAIQLKQSARKLNYHNTTTSEQLQFEQELEAQGLRPDQLFSSPLQTPHALQPSGKILRQARPIPGREDAFNAGVDGVDAKPAMQNAYLRTEQQELRQYRRRMQRQQNSLFDEGSIPYVAEDKRTKQ